MKVCRNCNQTNPVEAMFCRQCATPLDSVQPNQQQSPNPQYANPQYANPPQFNQQQWNQPNYGNQGVQQNFAKPSGGASSRATQSAILAVVALLCCGFLTGIPAAIMGWLEIQAIKEGKSSPDGMMMAQVGLWLGIGGTIINAIINFIGVLILMAGGGGY